jgi:hypothetical protein
MRKKGKGPEVLKKQWGKNRPSYSTTILIVCRAQSRPRYYAARTLHGRTRSGDGEQLHVCRTTAGCRNICGAQMSAVSDPTITARGWGRGEGGRAAFTSGHSVAANHLPCYASNPGISYWNRHCRTKSLVHFSHPPTDPQDEWLYNDTYPGSPIYY